LEINNCTPFTTEMISATILNADEHGVTLGPIVSTGSPVSCEKLAQGDVEGFKIVGNSWNFDNPMGDISIPLAIVCQ